MTPTQESTTPDDAPGPGASYTRRLLHRWLVEYNPLYLLSAALVLAGTFLCSRGLADGEQLHPMQAAFVHHDGFQCGYCTPGQICSAVGMISEHKAGAPSLVTEDLTSHPDLGDAEIRERMSGNICRCSAYPNIVAAIQDAAGETI